MNNCAAARAFREDLIAVQFPADRGDLQDAVFDLEHVRVIRVVLPLVVAPAYLIGAGSRGLVGEFRLPVIGISGKIIAPIVASIKIIEPSLYVVIRGKFHLRPDQTRAIDDKRCLHQLICLDHLTGMVQRYLQEIWETEDASTWKRAVTVSGVVVAVTSILVHSPGGR